MREKALRIRHDADRTMTETVPNTDQENVAESTETNGVHVTDTEYNNGSNWDWNMAPMGFSSWMSFADDLGFKEFEG